MIALGLRCGWLGTRRLSWRDLLVIVKHSPRTSALARGIHGPAAEWGLPEHLWAGMFDLLAAANWQRAGDEKAKRPKPLPRPGATAPVDGETMARGKPVTTDQMDALLGWKKE